MWKPNASPVPSESLVALALDSPKETIENAVDTTEDEGIFGESSFQRADLLLPPTGERIDQLSLDSRSSCISPASSSGGVYSTDLLDLFSLNLHRIDKDVQRCDRNYWYFTPPNLEKLRNVMCT